MLKGISPIVFPDLLKILSEMGHGDEIVLADAHFPGHSLNKRILRADGSEIHKLLRGIIPLFELDIDAGPLLMMATPSGEELDTTIEGRYREALSQGISNPVITRLDRFAFYDRAKNAYAVVITGETAKYANIILKKGVTIAPSE